MTTRRPLISVICCAHNEEKYVDKSMPNLLKALKGFPYEIIFVADRCTDNTVEKVRKYKVKACRLTKIGVVIPARNEEAYLGKTLEHLLNQTLKPDKIIVVDDGSSDRTTEIAKRFNVTVVQIPDRGYSVLAMPEEAKVRNIGLRFLDEIGEFEYVMILDADQLLSKTYIEKVVARMEEDKKLVIASGKIVGESSRAPRGSGRVYRFGFLRRIGYFPINYGAESYPLFKALKLGYKIEVFRDILSYGQRPTSLSSEKLYFSGKGIKALGYDPLYFLGRCALTFLRTPQGAINMLRGYVSSDVREYSDLKNFTKKWQRKILLKRLKEVFNSLKEK